MKRNRTLRRALIIPILLIALSAASSEDGEEPEIHNELLHSDVPLWGSSDKLWPQHFNDDDSFGCTNRAAYGDWKLVDHEGEESWWRLQNYGVFHCAIVESRHRDWESLDEGDWHYSFLINLGQTNSTDRELELWALQSGVVPGSSYTLLAREPSDGIIKSFFLLQQECPRKNLRKGPDLDVWITSYCVINSQKELVDLAKRMAKRPFWGIANLISEKTESNKISDN